VKAIPFWKGRRGKKTDDAAARPETRRNVAKGKTWTHRKNDRLMALPSSHSEAHLLPDLGRLLLGRGDDLPPDPLGHVVRVREAPDGQDPAVLAVMTVGVALLTPLLADGLDGDRREEMDDGVERLGDPPVICQVGDDEPGHLAERLDDLVLIARSGQVEIEDERGIVDAAEGLFDGQEDGFPLGGKAADDEDGVEGDGENLVAGLLVMEQHADELGRLQAVDRKDRLLGGHDVEVPLAGLGHVDIPERGPIDGAIVENGVLQVRPEQGGETEVGVGRVGRAEVGPLQNGFLEVGPLEVGLAQVGLAQVGLKKRGLAEDGADELGPEEGGLAEVGPFHAGLEKAGSAEVGPDEEGPGEVGPVEVGAGHVRLAEVGLEQVRPAEVGLAEVGPEELGPGQVGAAEVRPGELGPAEVGLGQVGPGQVELREVCAGEIGHDLGVFSAPLVPVVDPVPDDIDVPRVRHWTHSRRIALPLSIAPMEPRMNW
jgi:hypothetical protein